MRKSVTAWSLIAGLLFFASAATAKQSVNDAAIQSAVENKLQHKDISNGGGPWVGVENGVVTLRGKVKSVWAKNEAIKRALDVENVVAVEDELEIAFGESDEKVAEEIAKRIRSYPFFTVYDDVSMTIDGGHVNLTGRVTMPFKATEIEKRASKVMGVQSVSSEIRTLPTNIGDSRLRRALTNRIYGDSMFREYAYRVNPPIHIVVERGHVTLTGAVRSEVEKRRAEHIARATFGVFSVENLLQIGD